MQQLCFVLMPFGVKPGPAGMMIDFDAVWREVIAPAVREASMEAVRADEEQCGGIIHKAMFERLVLCPFAVADLTTANANVFYELGVRHGVKPFSTTLMFARNAGDLPFDVKMLRALPYDLAPNGRPADSVCVKQALVQRLHAAKNGDTDSPVHQLLEGFPDIQRLKTDVFREQVGYSRRAKERLAAARDASDADAVRQLEAEMIGKAGALVDIEAGIVIDLYLSYRALKLWGDMVRLQKAMARPLAETTLVREQLGFALNRLRQHGAAERVLRELIDDRGPSSETYGLLGRVYKDQWEECLQAGREAEAKGRLQMAIDAYRRGFETDMRDAYPGINAVTLMELADPPDPARRQLVEVVRYANERRRLSRSPDYWDSATLLELAVLSLDETTATQALGQALICVREPWELETTMRNLRLIAEARDRRGEAVAWAADVSAALAAKHEAMQQRTG